MDTLMTGKDFIARLDELLNERCMSVNDMCAEGDISREAFRTKKEQIESQLAELEENNQACRNYIAEAEGEEERLNRIASLEEFIKMKAFDPAAKIPESFIEAFVDRIVFDKGVFSWYLNPKFGNEVFDIDTTDWKKTMLNGKKKRTTQHQLIPAITAQ